MRQASHATPFGVYSEPAGTPEEIAARAVEAERKRRAERRGQRILRWIATAIGVFVSGWFFMLAVGVARAEWLPDLPTIEYGASVVLTSLLYGAALFQTLGRSVAKDLRRDRATYRATARNTGAATATGGGTANSGNLYR